MPSFHTLQFSQSSTPPPLHTYNLSAVHQPHCGAMPNMYNFHTFIMSEYIFVIVYYNILLINFEIGRTMRQRPSPTFSSRHGLITEFQKVLLVSWSSTRWHNKCTNLMLDQHLYIAGNIHYI